MATNRWCWVLGALGLLACDKTEDAAGDVGPSTTATPAGSQAAATTPGAATASGSAAAEKPVCVVKKEKSWGKGANRRTGLTPTVLPNGKLAVGLAFGHRPAVLVIDKDGSAHISRIQQQAGSKVAKNVSASDGRRDLQRVTPMVKDGKTIAFADYRDKLKNDERRIACGPAESDRTFLDFDGIPILKRLEKDDKKADEKKKDDKDAKPGDPKATVGQKVARLKKGALKPKILIPKLKPKAPDKEKQEELKEVRDCRTFVDQRNKRTWSVGSELVAKPEGDGHDFSMRFFVRTESGGRVRLHSVGLGKEPDKLHTLEAPIAHHFPDGSAVLVGRYRGALLGFQLDKDLRKKGSTKRFGGGYPTLARFAVDGSDHLLWTSQKVAQDRWELSQMKLINGGFASKLNKLSDLDERKRSQAEPSFGRAGDQRWVTYQVGGRRQSELEIRPLDGDFTAAGQPYVVSAGEGNEVYESLLHPLVDGSLFVLFIRSPKGQAAEVVSQVLQCEVRR